MGRSPSDERMDLSFARVRVSSNKPIVSVYDLHFTCIKCMYMQHMQSICQSRLSAADMHSADLGSSLHSLGADPTENTAHNNFSIFVMIGVPRGNVFTER
jgi:hypothetical protein